MSITGEPNGEPVKVGVALADIVAGKDAAIVIVAALVGRSGGRDVQRRIVVSLMDSARAALVNIAQNAIDSGKEPKRWGNAHPNIVPYQAFHAEDQPIVIAVGSDSQWSALVAALGLEDLANDRLLDRNSGRLAARERIVGRVAQLIRTRPAAHWIAALDKAGVPSGIVKSVLQALEDTNASPVMGMPSSVGGAWRSPPPDLNEHGTEIRTKRWRIFDTAENP